MDFSSANTALWNPMIQLGIICALILLANVLRRKVAFIQKSLIPTAVLAGFMLLILKSTNLIPFDSDFMEMLTYHMLAIGFISMSLRIPDKQSSSGALIGSKSGALIVSTYLVQALVGLGFTRNESAQAVKKARDKGAVTVEEVIMKALQGGI